MDFARTFISGLLGIFAILVSLVVIAPAGAAISEAEAVSLIEKAKILSPDCHLQARIGSGEAALSMYRNPKANDKDCKIDSLLCAKVLMDADPAGISTVKVRFYDPANRNSFREVNVGKGVVQAFGAGRMSQDELLSSVVVERGEQNLSKRTEHGRQQMTDSPEVLPGIYRGERMELLGRIQALRDKRVGVQPFMSFFYRIEDFVRQGQQAEVIHGLEALSKKIAEQEERSKEAGARHLMPGASFSARPHHGGQAATAPWASPSSEGASDLVQRMKRELGDDAPGFGPMLQRRYRIARKIREMQSDGRIVDEDKRNFREIEDLVRQGNAAALKMKLTVTEHRLGLPSFDQQ